MDLILQQWLVRYVSPMNFLQSRIIGVTTSKACFHFCHIYEPQDLVLYAVGTPAKSQFYMDQSHKTVTEPPPKPARQSVIQQTVSKAKDSWEDALENWSVKRKENSARSTWYSTESYPTGTTVFPLWRCQTKNIVALGVVWFYAKFDFELCSLILFSFYCLINESF